MTGRLIALVTLSTLVPRRWLRQVIGFRRNG